MELPYDRPRFIEFHEQPWVPSFIRRPVQDTLTTVWHKKFPPFQWEAPYEAVANVLGEIVEGLEDSGGPLRIVDCCSGAGGPMPAVERKMNRDRQKRSLAPVSVLLSDIHPHTAAWERLSASSQSGSLSSIPYAVDATRAPSAISEQRHFRTFCLAFHHFDEQGAGRVLEDAMRTGEGIGIFELQSPDFSSLFIVTLLFPLTLITIPFQRPSLTTLLFTYLIPLIPLILVLDGYVSAWRTRSFPHLMHLAEQAQKTVNAERKAVNGQAVKWTWKSGRRKHTWPCGYMTWIVGMKDVNA